MLLKNLLYLFFIILNNANYIDCFNLEINRRNFIKQSVYSCSNLYLSGNKLLENKSLDDDNNDTDDDDETNINYSNSKNGIYLTGPLTSETCVDLTNALINIKKQLLFNTNNNNNINFFIQSPGGLLLPTLALVDEIKNMEIPIHTYIRGYAASAATLLSVVGKKRYMYKHSIMMIHGIKLNGQESNTYNDVIDLNDNVNLFMSILKNIYLENSNISESKLEEFFLRDKWISANEALSYGLIDEII
tara:strand:+ start:835 stop:1572 length:738 start_codon:yes stop_codon:yes gene_type:complete